MPTTNASIRAASLDDLAIFLIRQRSPPPMIPMDAVLAEPGDAADAGISCGLVAGSPRGLSWSFAELT